MARRASEATFFAPLPGSVTLRSMTARSVCRTCGVAILVMLATGVSVAQRASASRPGYTGGGVTLLPNGWRISPAGRHMTIGDLPLAMSLSPDGHALIVTNNGHMR